MQYEAFGIQQRPLYIAADLAQPQQSPPISHTEHNIF